MFMAYGLELPPVRKVIRCPPLLEKLNPRNVEVFEKLIPSSFTPIFMAYELELSPVRKFIRCPPLLEKLNPRIAEVFEKLTPLSFTPMEAA
jgi:hypothetical protein